MRENKVTKDAITTVELWNMTYGWQPREIVKTLTALGWTPDEIVLLLNQARIVEGGINGTHTET